MYTNHTVQYIMCSFAGFSPDQYNFDDPTKGNRVYFTNGDNRVECLVYTYYTTTEQIVCDTGYVVYYVDIYILQTGVISCWRIYCQTPLIHSYHYILWLYSPSWFICKNIKPGSDTLWPG